MSRYGVEIYYDEVLAFGQPPQYTNFKYGGLIDIEDDGFNEMTVSMKDGIITRHYKHNIFIPKGIAMKMLEAGNMNKQSFPAYADAYDPALYSYTRQSYYTQLNIFISYLYELLMRRLLEVGFKPSDDEWYTNMGAPTVYECSGEEASSPTNNIVWLELPCKVGMRFFGNREGLSEPFGMQILHHIGYIVHNMYVTDNLKMQIFNALNIANDVPDENYINRTYVGEHDYEDIVWKKDDAVAIHQIMDAYSKCDGLYNETGAFDMDIDDEEEYDEEEDASDN